MSPHSIVGIDGIGVQITSSPVSPGAHSLPSGSKARTSQPSIRVLISPARTGTTGAEPRNAVHTSVPPLIEHSCTSAPTWSRTQRKPSAGSGEPVEPSCRSAPRSKSRAGSMPAARHPMMNGAPTPSTDTCSSAAIDHNVSSVGMAGIAVEQHDGGAGQQPGHEVVPHHPARRGEPHERVVGTHVVVQPQRLEVLDDHATVAVHDRLRDAGRARREQDVQRMIERNGLDVERCPLRPAVRSTRSRRRRPDPAAARPGTPARPHGSASAVRRRARRRGARTTRRASRSGTRRR